MSDDRAGRRPRSARPRPCATRTRSAKNSTTPITASEDDDGDEHLDELVECRHPACLLATGLIRAVQRRWTAGRGRGAAPRPRSARADQPTAGASCQAWPTDYDDGQDASICRGRPWCSAPVIQAVISFQNEPAPTAPGIRSEPSKRNTASGSCRISADSLSIGLTRLARSRPLLALTQPPVRSRLGLLVGPDVRGQVGLERLHLGTVGEGGDELAAAEDRLAVVRVGRRQVEREDVAVLGDLGALGPVGRVEGRLAVHRALAVEDRQAAVLEGRRGDVLTSPRPPLTYFVVLQDVADRGRAPRRPSGR